MLLTGEGNKFFYLFELHRCEDKWNLAVVSLSFYAALKTVDIVSSYY